MPARHILLPEAERPYDSKVPLRPDERLERAVEFSEKRRVFLAKTERTAQAGWLALNHRLRERVGDFEAGVVGLGQDILVRRHGRGDSVHPVGL